jgi:hypothetical protein
MLLKPTLDLVRTADINDLAIAVGEDVYTWAVVV